jgi:hypothetical protein
MNLMFLIFSTYIPNPNIRILISVTKMRDLGTLQDPAEIIIILYYYYYLHKTTTTIASTSTKATMTTTMFIRRCFGTTRVTLLPPVSSPPRTTTADVIATISRQRFDRMRPRSLSTTTTTNARISSVLLGLGTRRIQHTADDDGLTGFRYFSSRNSKKNKRFNLRALPFSISPEEALESFKKWAEDDQGLRYLMSYNSVRIVAAYVPVWSFDMNIRFKQQQTTGNNKGRGSSSNLYSWKPPIFEGYDDLGGGGSSQGSRQDVIYLPGGLSAYAGYSYRRSLINPVHSTTLIFMGDQTEPFGGWMLKDMKLQETGIPIHVIPDAWNSTQGRAFSMVKEELQVIVDGDWANSGLNNGDTPPPIAQTQVVSARRVFMPTFVIDYKIFGLEYQAFVSGCDTSAPVGGVSHQIFEGSDSNTTIEGLSPEFHRSSRNLLVQLSSGASQLLRTFNVPVLLTIFRPLFSILWFTVVRIFAFTPVIGVAGGLFAGFRKVIQPWMDNRKASADWERQRQHEAEMAEDENSNKMNDFNDVSGRARAHFLQNKDSILRSLSGDVRHEEGDFDWYSDWQGA